jgi:hypothetical protein
MRRSVFFVLLPVISYCGAQAQCTDYKWPQEQAKAEKYVDAFKSAMKDQDYRRAIPGIQWMIAHAPQWHTDLYVAANETYDNLAEKELDPALKERYIDSLFIIYDLRIRNCGNEKYVLNRKAYSARKYYNSNKEKAAESLAIFDKTFDVSGNDVLDNNLIGYVDAIKINNLPAEQVVKRYIKLVQVIDFKMKKAKAESHLDEIAKYNKVAVYIDNRLPKMANFDCSLLHSYIEPAFKSNPSSLTLARDVFDIVVDKKCPYDAVWFEAAELLHASSPSVFIAKELAVAYIGQQHLDKGAKLLGEVEEKAKTAPEKAWINLLNGDLENQKGDKVKARDSYKQALVVDPSGKEPYERIGDLYASSSNDCSKVTGSAEEKLVYIAAFQMYLKSGNREKMEQALSKYPTADDLKKANWKSGETKKIPCWIDEVVIVKVKKEKDLTAATK